MATAETARLIAQLELRDQGFTRGLGKIEKGIGRVDSKLGAVSGALNRNLSRAIDSLVSRGVDALAGTIGDASDLNEEVTKSDAVFGKSAKEIQAWGDTTASALGIAKVDALGAAGAFGNMFNTVGLTNDQSADFSKTMVELAADMASFNNEDPTVMLDKLRSGLSGEAEPLRRYGVLLSENAVKEEAYASGLAKKGDKLTEAQKVQARYNLILKQTAIQQGDVEKTGGNLAGQQRKLNALLKDASATIGTSLLPVVTDVTSEFVKLFQDPATQKGIKAFGKQLGEGAKSLVAALKQVNWKSFADAIGTAAGFAKDLVSAFLSLPPWVQTAVVTGWGLNKLTGGGVTNLLGKAFGAGIDLFKGRGSTPANPLFVSGVGGGLGGPMGGGKGGRFGRFGGAVGLVAGTVAVVGFEKAYEIWSETNQRSTEQANTAHESLNKMLGQGASLDAMQTSLAAVNTGINQIQSNPLLTIVQGEALDELKGMRAQLEKAIEERARPVINEQAPRNAAANQASIGSRENRATTTADPKVTRSLDEQRSELGNIKNNLTTMKGYSQSQVTELGNVKNATATLDTTVRTQSVAQIATDALLGTLQAGRDAVQRATTAQAGTTAATASRSAGATVSSSMSSAASRIVTAIWQARPVIQSTNVVNNYTRTERGGASGDSRTRRAD